MDRQRQAEGMECVDPGGRQVGFPALALPSHDVTQKVTFEDDHV